MLRALLSRISSLLGTDSENERGEDENRGFRRSELDASVLSAHAGDVERLDREMADIEEQAREYENARRED